MSKLQILYSKEIAKELGKIAIYLPGEHVEVGDIITFPHGQSILNKARPLGSFRKISSLKNLNVEYLKSIHSKQKNTYRYSSTERVSISSNLEVDGDFGNQHLPSLNSNIKLNFNKQGAIYLIANNCYNIQIEDLYALENKIDINHKKGILWDDSFLVTSVTIAEKAFVAQSHSDSSQLCIKGDVNAFKYGGIKADANTNFSITKHQGDIFVKDWSEHVNVFMDVVRFDVKVFRENTRSFNAQPENLPSTTQVKFKSVDINELVTN